MLSVYSLKSVFTLYLLILSSILYSQTLNNNQDYVVTGLCGGGEMGALAVGAVDQNMLLMSSNMSGVYFTTTGPKHWEMVHYTDLLYVGNTKACFHPNDKNIIYAPFPKGLKVSRDKGQTWDSIGNIGRIQYGLAIHPERTQWMLAGSDGKVWQSMDSGSNWTTANGPTGRIQGFHFDRTSTKICFAATSGGIWRSIDSGDSWTRMSGGLPSGTLTAFCGASNKKQQTTLLYCCIDQIVYRSADKGESWSVISSAPVGKVTYLLASDVNPQIVWLTAGSIQIFRSENAGDTWIQTYFPDPADSKFNLEHNYFTSWMGKNASNHVTDAAIAPNNPDYMIFTSSMICIYTEDGGKSWKNAFSESVGKQGELIPKSFLNTGLNVTTTWHYYVDPFEQKRQYLAYTDIGFARSVDSGKSWLFWPYRGAGSKLPIQWTFNLYEMAFDPEIPGKMWGAFSRAHDLPNANSILRDHYTRHSDTERKGGVGFSSDFAETWDDDGYNNGLPGRPTLSVVVDPRSPKNQRTLYAAVYDEGIYKSTDDGHNWVKKSTGIGSETNMHVVRVQIHQDGTLFCLVTATRDFSPDGPGLFRSKDGGEHWEKVNQSQEILWPKDFTVHPTNSNEIYIGADEAENQKGALWRSVDGGKSWTVLAGKGSHFGAYLHPSRPGWIYMTLCEDHKIMCGLWLSKDNGLSWQPYSKIPHRWIQRVDFDPKNPDVIYVATFGASALRLPADPNNALKEY